MIGEFGMSGSYVEFRVDSDGKLIIEPWRNFGANGIAAWTGTSFAVPNVTAGFINCVASQCRGSSASTLQQVWADMRGQIFANNATSPLFLTQDGVLP